METSIDEGCTVFDFTVGDDAYKEDWTDVVLPLYSLAMPLSLDAHIHQRAAAAKHTLREGLKNIRWIRGAVVRVREASPKLIQAEEGCEGGDEQNRSGYVNATA